MSKTLNGKRKREESDEGTDSVKDNVKSQVGDTAAASGAPAAGATGAADAGGANIADADADGGSKGDVCVGSFAEMQKTVLALKKAHDENVETTKQSEQKLTYNQAKLFVIWTREKRAKALGLKKLSGDLVKELEESLGPILKNLSAKKLKTDPKANSQKDGDVKDSKTGTNSADGPKEKEKDAKLAERQKCQSCDRLVYAEDLLFYFLKAGRQSLEIHSAYGDNYEEDDLAKSLLHTRVKSVCESCAAFIVEDVHKASEDSSDVKKKGAKNKTSGPVKSALCQVSFLWDDATFPGEDEADLGGAEPVSAGDVIRRMYNDELDPELQSDQSDDEDGDGSSDDAADAAGSGSDNDKSDE